MVGKLAKGKPEPRQSRMLDKFVGGGDLDNNKVSEKFPVGIRRGYKEVNGKSLDGELHSHLEGAEDVKVTTEHMVRKYRGSTEKELIRDAIRAREFSGVETLLEGLELIDFVLKARRVKIEKG